MYHLQNENSLENSMKWSCRRSRFMKAAGLLAHGLCYDAWPRLESGNNARNGLWWFFIFRFGSDTNRNEALPETTLMVYDTHIVTFAFVNICIFIIQKIVRDKNVSNQYSVTTRSFHAKWDQSLTLVTIYYSYHYSSLIQRNWLIYKFKWPYFQIRQLLISVCQFLIRDVLDEVGLIYFSIVPKIWSNDISLE